MLSELSVENLAIINRSDLQFGPGFTVFTGETGAGKSLLIDAIELALGERADSELVRTGARNASVSVVFDLSSAPEAAAKCDELGLPLEDGALFIQRDVLAEGRSQCRIGGRLTPLSVVRQVGAVLVDLHGQHEHQSLLFPERHLPFLDHWIGSPAEGLRARVAGHFAQVSQIRKELVALQSDIRDREHRLDLLRYQVREIEEVAPMHGEWDQLHAELGRLQNVERLATATSTALNLLTEKEGSAVESLGSSLQALDEAVRFDPTIEAITTQLRDGLYQLEEALRELGTYADSLEADPGRLDELSNRLECLKKLRRKYGDDESAVLGFLEGARADLAQLENAEASQEDLAAQLEIAERLLGESAGELSVLRREHAGQFSKFVEAQLQDLSMERARFDVSFQNQEPDAAGCDSVEFLFSANAGEPVRPLSRIASGGEVSRLMLAINSVVAGRAGVPTMVFDEVDTGLGGRVAFTLGRKLEELASSYQVLVISHLPQVAARAGTHFRVEKVEHEGRSVARVHRLTSEERVHEIARMLGGERISEAAIANARELLGESLSDEVVESLGTDRPASTALFD